MSGQEVFEGVVENIVFHNKENGYSVFRMSPADSKDFDEDELTCVGYIVDLSEGENIKVTGSFVNHPTYGRQMQVEHYNKTMPTTVYGMEKYLGSGVIRGIGPRMAKKIVSVFGEKTFEIMENNPEKLAKIRGISLDKAVKYAAVFHEQADQRAAMIYLQDYGISPLFALKIYKQYKDKTLEVVKVNPYRLADDIFGIGFKMSDRLAEISGIQRDSSFRIKAGIKYILSNASNDGHTYLPRDLLRLETSKLLQLPEDLIDNYIYELQVEMQVKQDSIDGTQVVYLNVFYYSEQYVAKKLLSLVESFIPEDIGNIEKDIDNFQKVNNVFLHQNQQEAVKEAMANGVLVITGGPGTGKTTTINTIINLLLRQKKKVSLTAPTGRAAKRMTEATGMEAKTLHRLLEVTRLDDDSRKQTFERNEENPLDLDVIIVDESSMVDILLMGSLLKAVPEGARLILVGDVDQLPSVGPGNVLKDIIKSGCIKVVCLTEIFRQARESAIVMNAHRINKGQYPELNEKEKDFFFMKKSNVDDVIALLIELITVRLPNFSGLTAKEGIQVLTPMRKSPIGMYNLNVVLQKALNPSSPSKNEKEYRNIVFREGDKVMQIKNNYSLIWKTRNSKNEVVDDGMGVFNGDEGFISTIDEDNEIIKVIFDDNKIVNYDYSQLDELEHAYAITIHKAQGSEYPVVIIPIHSGPPMLLTRNLLYTAVTRAKTLVVIVGLKETLFKMVDNSREIYRFSSLNKRIVSLISLSLQYTLDEGAE